MFIVVRALLEMGPPTAVLCSLILSVVMVTAKQPNIVVIIADDMGWNDASMHGSNQIPTKNIDALGYNGQILHRHYTQHICTPSRTAFLTGNYPIRSGMQGTPLRAGEDRPLDRRMEFLSERLNELGYRSHLVGKWHLGHAHKSATPTGRGFASHIGYWNGYVGYFNYTIQEDNFKGLDLHRNTKPDWKSVGTYATDLFTKEAVAVIDEHKTKKPLFLMIAHLAGHAGENGTKLEVPDPKEADERFGYISDPKRRLYAEIIRRLDLSVGDVVKALQRKDMLKDSIILFFSDNGAQTIGIFENHGSNWPLRGLKFTLNEGGVRNLATIWSPMLARKRTVNTQLVHITDWMPTLYAAAGGKVADLGLVDGVNQWPRFTEEGPSPPERAPVLLNIDETLKFKGILSSDGRYKVLCGTYPNGVYNGYYGDSGRNGAEPSYNLSAVLTSDVNVAIQNTNTQEPLDEGTIQHLRGQTEIQQGEQNGEPEMACSDCCLYDLQEDPTETTDVKSNNPSMFQSLMSAMDGYQRQLIPQKNNMVDPLSNPLFCKNVWFTWKDWFNKECFYLGSQ